MEMVKVIDDAGGIAWKHIGEDHVELFSSRIALRILRNHAYVTASLIGIDKSDNVRDEIMATLDAMLPVLAELGYDL